MILFESWNVHASIPVGLGLVAIAYATGIGPIRRRFRLAAAVEPLDVITFGTALVILFLVLTGPIHDLSDSYLFSAHMVQHLVITLIVPPLLLVGTPAWLVRPLLRPPAVHAAVRFLTRAPVAFTLFTLTLGLWHLPALYNATLLLLEVHIFEHLLFIATAIIAWWPVLSPLPEMRLRPPARVFYLILLTLPMKGIGALLTLADEVLYPAYALAPRVFGLGPFEDQRLGGLLMWLPAGLILWGAAAVIFFRWWETEQGPRVRAGESSASTPARFL